MKLIASFLAVAAFAVLQVGCAAKASVGNHDQHGAAVSTRTSGSNRGVHASVY
jgi:hypothetical protein